MKLKVLGLLLTFMVNATPQPYIPKFDLQGHRGCLSLKPENTIPSFIKALDLGVTTIELDVVITQDRKVVVSHEPWMSSEICLQPDRSSIEKQDEKDFNLFEMTYAEIQKFDCGSKGNAKFPEQEKMNVKKPLLSDVIVAVENYIKNSSQYEVDYNIEIKSTRSGDNKFHPAPEEFSDLVYNLINEYLPLDRVVIQSFDFRVLKYWHKKYPKVRLSALVENLNSPKKNLQELGFIPSVYSPAFKLLSKEKIEYLHTLTPAQPQPVSKLRVIPWTVNEIADMQQLKSWGVDGIITDYPDRAASLGLALKRNVSGKSRPASQMKTIKR